MIRLCKNVLSKKIPKEKNYKCQGFLIGKRYPDRIEILDVIQAKTDLRQKEPFKSYIDKMLEKYMISPPTSKQKIADCPYCYFRDRGFVISAEEYESVAEKSKKKGLEIVGIFHLHYCPYPTDMSSITKYDVMLWNPRLICAVVDMSYLAWKKILKAMPEIPKEDKPKSPQIRFYKVTYSKKVYEFPVKIF